MFFFVHPGKYRILKIFLFILFFFYLSSHTVAQTYQNGFRQKLPGKINGYQPSVVPVLTLDGNELYIDRKDYPNLDGTFEKNSIWYTKKINSVWTNPVFLPHPFNTAGANVVFSISPEGSKALVYGYKKSQDSTYQPAFSFIEKVSDSWSKTENLQIEDFSNKSGYFYGNLACTQDILLMSIERDEGFGDLDLYISFKDKNSGKWSKPENLGKIINTGGIETSPFLAFDLKTLYFISNGRNGKGALDVYYTKRLDDSWLNFSVPENLGDNINTKYDESSFFLTATGDTAIIASVDTTNLEKNLFFVSIPKRFQPEPYYILFGKIFFLNKFGMKSTYSGEVDILVANNNFKRINPSYQSSGNGKYMLIIPADSGCKVNFHSAQFQDESFYILSKAEKSSILTHDIIFKANDSASSALEIKKFIVYFDNNSYELPDSAKARLKSIFGDKDFSKNVINLNGFADKSGTEKHNQNLSINRTNAVLDFVKSISQIEKYKVTGFGETASTLDDEPEMRKVEIIILNSEF